MAKGTGFFEVGAMLTPDLVGGKLSGRARFTDNLFGFAEARGGYSFATGSPFGEAFIGLGGEF